MDASRFDTLSRALARGHSRRGLAWLLGTFALAGPQVLLGMTEATAKKNHKKKRRRRGSPPSPPPPPAPCIPTCSGRVCGDDGCGGTCGFPCDPCQMCQDGRCVPTTDLQT